MFMKNGYRKLTVRELVGISGKANTELQRVENAIWRDAYTRLAASADHVRRLEAGNVESDD